MTTTQLAARLAPHLTTPDLATMPGAAQLDIVAAMNAALGEVFAMLPPHFKRTSASETLLAPESVNYEFVARNESQLVDSVFETCDEGCTVRLGDDSHDNEVVSPNAVLDGFLGSTLSGTGTLYHDAVQLFEVIERVVGHPRLLRPDGVPACELLLNADIRRRQRQIGQPREYFVESVGFTQGAEPVSLLRVHPMPEREYIVRFDAEIAGARVTWAQLQGAGINLPCPQRVAEGALLPLAREQLLASAFFRDAAAAAPIIRSVAESGRRLLGSLPQNVAGGTNTVGTEGGY